MTPYTTKKGVKIGLLYQRRPPELTRDEEIVQAALLGVKTRKFPKIALLIVAVLACYLLASCIMLFK